MQLAFTAFKYSGLLNINVSIIFWKRGTLDKYKYMQYFWFPGDSPHQMARAHASLTKNSGEGPGRSPSPTTSRAEIGDGSGTRYAESGLASPAKPWTGNPGENGKEKDQFRSGEEPCKKS